MLPTTLLRRFFRKNLVRFGSSKEPDMTNFDKIMENNRAWARSNIEKDPDFFKRLVGVQSPKYLWIGCSDSRVPAN